MSKPKEVHVECYQIVIEAVTAKDESRITTAIGGLRNDSGHGRALGPFNLYQDDELNTITSTPRPIWTAPTSGM